MLTLILQTVSAQTNFSLSKENLEFLIKGTSSLHEWEIEVNNVSGQIVFNNNNRAIQGISALKVMVITSSITSDNGIMNRKTARALKADKYPVIYFNLDKVLSFTNSSGIIKGEISGSLEVAGTKKAIRIPFESSPVLSNTIKITGNTTILMSDFGIEPPTALAGTLKTGDRADIVFSTTWMQAELLTEK